LKHIAVDFDGCICTNEYPKIGQPNWDVINALKEKQKKGTALILWTCREKQLLLDAVQACSQWGLYFIAINDNPKSLQEQWGNNPRKLGVAEFWDDRAYNPIRERKFKELLADWKNERFEKVFDERQEVLAEKIKELEAVINA